jgi:hypothetical protein
MAEKIYSFTTYRSADSEPVTTNLKENELEDKHINHILGEQLYQYEQLPELVKEKFKKYILEYAK